MNVQARQTPFASAHIMCHPAQFTGGWLIDEHGREIAITEHMVQQACAALEEPCSENAQA
ncbi:PA1571 family protein [Halopseudomonas laoshanensis]|uniref:PA1571 family protein n=1 Tax=Halopseudomonas laoshanensis TaxID=2268758 RepID=UPI0037358B51